VQKPTSTCNAKACISRKAWEGHPFFT
jgi:hypothetical protein